MKIRMHNMWRRFRLWMEKVIDVKVKAVLLTGALATFTVVAFQYQVSSLSKDRFESVCDTRVLAREDLRAVLLYVVDLSDMFPDDHIAEEYTASRVSYIEERYPSLLLHDDC